MDRSGPGPPTRREDSWSDAATGALIEAWGDRYLRHNRGILRLKDWKEIADAVNAVADGAAAEADKPARIWSDAQCKNRVDTLKKKYKLERSKPSPSPWHFFHRLEILIGEGSAAAGDGGGGGGVKKKKRSKPVASAKPTPVAIAISPESPPEESIGGDGDGDGEGEGDGDVAARGLARALVRLGEVYERVERSKQRAVMELERQRMEFSKEIEFQRLNMFLEAQVEMAKSKNKRSKPGAHGSASAGKK